MNWYKINFDRLANLFTPELLKKESMMAVLRCFMRPMTTIYNLFLSFKAETDYKLSHNSQVCYLQAVLNDAFDYSDRRIYIEDAPVLEWTRLLWTEAEDKPIMLGVFMLQSEKFIGSDSIDFIVFVPNALGLNDNDFVKMNALLRYYKLAGKRYEIQMI